MKSLKHIALGSFLALSTFGVTLYSSCSKDKCKDVVCQNGGTCNEGTCTCATGYEGTNCETEVRKKVIATWTASDVRVSDNQAQPTYQSPIVAGATISDIKIGNFWGAFTHDVKATISGNTITVPSQQPDNDSFYVSGSATYNESDKKLTWSYTIKDPSNVEKAYKGTWTKP